MITKVNKDPSATLEFDPKKTSELYEELIKVYQKYKPTVGEILISYGNLGYALGTSIEGFSKEGPSIQELEELYYKEPGKIGTALALQGVTVTSWYEDWEKLVINKENSKTKEDK